MMVLNEGTLLMVISEVLSSTLDGEYEFGMVKVAHKAPASVEICVQTRDVQCLKSKQSRQGNTSVEGSKPED